MDGQAALIASNYGTIKNLVIENFYVETASHQLAAALVQNNQSSGVVQNITMTGSEIHGGNRVGGMVGENCGLVDSATNDGTVDGTSVVGGIVGLLCASGTVSNSHFSGNVTVATTNSGPIVGYNDGGTLTGNW